MPVVTVSNQSESTVVLSFRDPSKDHVEWAPKGDRDGMDVQVVDSDLVESMRFAQAVGEGLLKLDDGDEHLSEAIKKHLTRKRRPKGKTGPKMESLIKPNQYGQIVITEDELDAHIGNVAKHGEALIDPSAP
jgi:hypothetical protein